MAGSGRRAHGRYAQRLVISRRSSGVMLRDSQAMSTSRGADATTRRLLEELISWGASSPSGSRYARA